MPKNFYERERVKSDQGKLNNLGFTLIELLVVISIIGFLATASMVVFNSVRLKARDTAVKQGVREFAKLMQFEYDETGSYANLQSCLWVPRSAPNCNSMFSGTYAVKAREICNNIAANAKEIWGSPGYKLLICNALNKSQKFSIMATLPTTSNRFICIGSSGVSDNAQYWMGLPTYSATPGGCYYNP